MTQRYGWWPDCMHAQDHGAYVRYKDYERLQGAVSNVIEQMEGIPHDVVQHAINSLSIAMQPSAESEEAKR